MNLNAEHLDLMRGEVGKFSHCSCGRTGKFSHFSSLKLRTLLSNIYYVRGWTRKNIGWKVHHEQIACWMRKYKMVVTAGFMQWGNKWIVLLWLHTAAVIHRPERTTLNLLMRHRPYFYHYSEGQSLWAFPQKLSRILSGFWPYSYHHSEEQSLWEFPQKFPTI